MIALIVAGLVLIVVGGNSYNNYLRTQYEKEYGVLAKHQGQGSVVKPDAALGGSTASMAPINTSTLDPKGALPPTAMSGSAPATEGASSKTAPAYRADLLPPIPAAVMAAAKADPDPEIARFQARLKAMEQERVLLQQKLKGGGADAGLVAAPVAPVAGVVASAIPEESGSLREVLDQKPAGKVAGATAALFPQDTAANANTDASAEMAAKAEFARQIKDAPSAGKVVVYNSDWGFVQINTGNNQSVAVGTKFAVRRGGSIVGYVKVTEVNQQTALAEMTSRNQHSETARKPQAGDDVIPWPLF